MLFGIDIKGHPTDRRFFRLAHVILTAGMMLLAGMVGLGQDNDQAPVRVAPQPLKPSELRVGELFPALQGTAIDGRKFDLGSARKRTATVVALTSTSCPICKKYAPPLAKIEKQFAGQGVEFCFLNTLPSDKPEDIRADIRDHGFSGPYVHDTGDTWNDGLGIRTTAEVFVFDSARTLVYRGAVDDQYGLGYSLDAPRKTYLIDALYALIEGEAIEIAATTAPGCNIWQPKQADGAPSAIDVTYHNRISRIIQNNCVDCHREEGLGPFSLETADDLISHAGMIKTVVENGTMPPWFAKSEAGPSRWINDRSLSESDKKDLLSWLDSERKLGDPADAPRPRKFESEWNIGKPDITFQIPQPFSIKATGTMPYKYTFVKTEFQEDQWIKAVEIRPTDRSVVHHVLVFLRRPGSRQGADGTDGFFAAYVPGNSFQIFPDGFAKRIPAGSTLVFQLHYTPVGRATEDQTEIGFQFYEGTPQHEVQVKGIAQRKLDIPPHDSNYPRSKEFPVSSHVKLLAFMPHMHLRGKAFRYELISADEQDQQTILDIPRYDFNWQLVYRLAEPLTVNPGSKIKVTGWFDNSDQNPANPDPGRTVPWGDQTTDEMLIGYVEYYDPSATIDLESGDNDSEQAANRPAKRLDAARRAFLTKAFQRYDRDGDGKVTREEFNRPLAFKRMDRNGDDHLTLEEVLSSEEEQEKSDE